VRTSSRHKTDGMVIKTTATSDGVNRQAIFFDIQNSRQGKEPTESRKSRNKSQHQNRKKGRGKDRTGVFLETELYRELKPSSLRSWRLYRRANYCHFYGRKINLYIEEEGALGRAEVSRRDPHLRAVV
jgi:hypothetical protein